MTNSNHIHQTRNTTAPFPFFSSKQQIKKHMKKYMKKYQRKIGECKIHDNCYSSSIHIVNAKNKSGFLW